MPEGDAELLDYLRVMWRRRWLITAGTFICVAGTAIVTFLMPRLYESSADLSMGQVWEKPLENPRRVAAIINSMPFLDKVRERIGFKTTARELKDRGMVVAKAIEGDSRSAGAIPILINVVALGHSPQESVDLVMAVSEQVIQEHKPLFEEMMKEHSRFEKDLEAQVEAIKREIADLDAAIKSQRESPQVDAPAIILLQAQLEQKQTQLLEFIKELRDVRLNNSSRARTGNTRIVYPPVLPTIHVKPRLAVNAIVAGMVGLIAFIVLALFIDYVQQAARPEEHPTETQ